MARDARTTMVAGAAEMIGTRGVGATSVRELARHTGAPLGSTYHYFPGGKDQLVEEAVAWVSGAVERLLTRHADGGTLAVLDAFIQNWRQYLEASDYEASCPILAVATEDTATAGPAAAVFRRWQRLIALSLERDGVEPDRAARLSWLVVGSLEGAVVLSRSQRSPDPLEGVAAELRLVIEAALTP